MDSVGKETVFADRCSYVHPGRHHFMGFQVVGVLGSPLARGNTARLLDQALSGAHDAGCDVERIDITTMTISPAGRYSTAVNTRHAP